jgi:hypothetical protein
MSEKKYLITNPELLNHRARTRPSSEIKKCFVKEGLWDASGVIKGGVYLNKPSDFRQEVISMESDVVNYSALLWQSFAHPWTVVRHDTDWRGQKHESVFCKHDLQYKATRGAQYLQGWKDSGHISSGIVWTQKQLHTETWKQEHPSETLFSFVEITFSIGTTRWM